MSVYSITSINTQIQYSKSKIFNLDDGDEYLAVCDGTRKVTLYKLPEFEKSTLTFSQNIFDLVYQDQFLGVFYRGDTAYYVTINGGVVKNIWLNRKILDISTSPNGNYVVVKLYGGLFARRLDINKDLTIDVMDGIVSVNDQGIIYSYNSFSNYSINFSRCAINVGEYSVVGGTNYSDLNPCEYGVNLRNFDPVHFDSDSNFFLTGSKIIKIFKSFQEPAVASKLLERPYQNFLLSKNFFIAYSFINTIDIYLKSEITADVNVFDYTYVKYPNTLTKRHITSQILTQELPDYPIKFGEDESFKMMMLYYPLNLMDEKIIFIDVDVTDETLMVLNPQFIFRTATMQHSTHDGDKIIILNTNNKSIIEIHDYIRQYLHQGDFTRLDVSVKDGTVNSVL